MQISRKMAVATVLTCAVVGLSAGTVLASGTHDDSESRSTTSTSSLDFPQIFGDNLKEATESYPENEFGLTVGTPTETDRINQNLPDLTPATTDDGKDGYIVSKDYFLPTPKTPEEAAAQTRNRINDKGEIILKVYGPDGKTLLGTQLVGQISMD